MNFLMRISWPSRNHFLGKALNFGELGEEENFLFTNIEMSIFSGEYRNNRSYRIIDIEKRCEKEKEDKHEVMAWLDEMQAIVTVCAGILSGNPLASRHSRAKFDVRNSCITLPNTTYSTTSVQAWGWMWIDYAENSEGAMVFSK